MKNLTETGVYKALQADRKRWNSVHLRDLFARNKNRSGELSVSTGSFLYDFSRILWDKKTLDLWAAMADELHLAEAIRALFAGEKVNVTENRPALHTALRDFSGEALYVDGKDVTEEVRAVRKKIKDFAENFRRGAWKGATGKPLKYIVNIGIGGSRLGPEAVITALQDKAKFPVYFLSNVDGQMLQDIMAKVPLEETLFLVVSKSFGTRETLMNAGAVKNMLISRLGAGAVRKHFVAVSSRTDRVEAFGIDKDNIFPMWDWVGGRYSLWSAVGLSIALSLGYEVFERLLRGAFEADIHFKSRPWKENIPVLMAFQTLWHTHFFDVKAEAYIPYRNRLKMFPFWLQQLVMESNGKSVQRDGRPVGFSTSPVVFGDTGTDAQHSFFQMLHQGTQMVPVHFLAYVRAENTLVENDRFLMANLLAQADSLAMGKNATDPHRQFPGNRPSTLLLMDKLNPETLGFLLALFEHKTYVESIFWNINAFDQFGVELGKINAGKWYDWLGKEPNVSHMAGEFIRRNLNP